MSGAAASTPMSTGGSRRSRTRAAGRGPDRSRRPPDHQRAPRPPRRSHPLCRRTPRCGHRDARLTPARSATSTSPRPYSSAAPGLAARPVCIVTCLDHRVATSVPRPGRPYCRARERYPHHSGPVLIDTAPTREGNPWTYGYRLAVPVGDHRSRKRRGLAHRRWQHRCPMGHRPRRPNSGVPRVHSQQGGAPAPAEGVEIP
jgi:hypothetical protein